jgi:hypothetical protein
VDLGLVFFGVGNLEVNAGVGRHRTDPLIRTSSSLPA